MKKKLYAAAAFGAVGILAGSLLWTGTSSATVPGVNSLLSVDSSGNQSNQVSYQPSVSGDGRYVAFESQASNLVSDDTNSARDIFVRDRTNSTTVRADVSSAGVEANADATQAKISYNGRFVVFASSASNLVGSDTNGTSDIFIRDLQSGTTTRVNTATSGTQGNGGASWPDVSADGRFVTYMSSGNTLDTSISGTVTNFQVYVKDMKTGANKMLSHSAGNVVGDAGSSAPRISCDGGVVVFESRSTNLVASDTNGYGDVFVVTQGWSGDDLVNATINGNQNSQFPTVSCDGNFVAIQSGANNLLSGTTTSGLNIYRYNRLDSTFQVASKYTSGSLGTASNQYPEISGDGRFIVFETDEQFSANDTNPRTDIYLRDMRGATTQLLSINKTGTAAAGFTSMSSISDDGTYAVYEGFSPNIVSNDTNGYQDIFGSETGF